MTEEFQKHAFEPFTQERDRARSVYSGSGLGLAITKQLVDLMGGTIELKSKVNEGTTFTVTLPLDVDETAEMPEPQADHATAQRCAEGMHILVAEDNDLNRKIIRFVLEREGSMPVEARNGQEALETLRASEPGAFDFVLMDVMMPVMDGLAATRAIRELGDVRSEIPIFAMTANVFQDDVQRCIDAGMNEHLSKPLKVSELRQAIAKHVKKPR